MPLELRHVTSANEVPEIVQGWIENEFILTPTLTSVDWGTDESSSKDRLEDLSARQWYAHSTTPGSVWIKVVDTDHSDMVVAASRWVIQTKTRALDAAVAPTARAYWLPPGPSRRFTEAVRDNYNAVRNGPSRQKPHVRGATDLVTNYTVSEYRRRGVNTLMIEWGTKKADELGLETWLEATPLGSMIYAKHGFGFLKMVELYPPTELHEDNDQWRHWEEATKDLRLAVMRRPVNGVWDHEKGEVPAHDLDRNIWLK